MHHVPLSKLKINSCKIMQTCECDNSDNPSANKVKKGKSREPSYHREELHNLALTHCPRQAALHQALHQQHSSGLQVSATTLHSKATNQRCTCTPMLQSMHKHGATWCPGVPPAPPAALVTGCQAFEFLSSIYSPFVQQQTASAQHIKQSKTRK